MMLLTNIIIVLFCMIGFATVGAVILIEVPEKIEEFMDRQCKIQFLCKHEYVRKCEWTSFEHDFSNYGVCRKIELQCRKCGKKKTIRIYEEEVE